jgi:hypothetical protein
MGLITYRRPQITLENHFAATPVTTPGTSIVAHADIHTKGSWTELIAATAYNAYGFWLYIAETATSGAATDALLDIGIGSAGNEVIIVPDMIAGYRTTGNGTIVFIPIFIPRGTRIAARCQALITADTVAVHVVLQSGLAGPGSQSMFVGCDAYGITAAASQGTAHTPGNTGTESADANIGSATSRSYGAVLLVVQSEGDTNQSTVGLHWELTIGGVTIAEWFYRTSTTEATTGPIPAGPVRVNIPAATQLQVQAESSGAGVVYDVALYCFY